MNTHVTPQRVLGKDAIQGVAAAVAGHIGGALLLLVCDDTTWIAAGEAVQAQLAPRYKVAAHSIGRYIRPQLSHTAPLMEIAKDYDGLIAIGSGTVNDITKYAAAKLGKPYIAVATAASMNGYGSANASLEEQGVKHSYQAAPPRAVVADSAVLAAAPKRLTRAGLADTLCRSTVEADMLMSHLLFNSGYPRALFDKLRVHEADLIAGAGATRESDPAFINKLMVALLDAGDVMTEYGSSAVASQGEHMIAHTLELNYAPELRNIYHGELIALTTLTMNHLQHKILLSQPSVKPLKRDENNFLRLFSKKISRELATNYQRKAIQAEQATVLNAHIVKHWAEIKAALLEIMAPPNSVERAFVQSGLSTRATEIGLSEEGYRFGCTHAYLTRDRFTFLDLAAMNDKRVW